MSERSELSGKVAIVTGASKGIGAAIAKGLGAAGAAVAVNYASSKEGADRVVAEITGKGGKAIAVKGDVSKAADVKRLFAETKKAFGAPDVLVNNAGIYAFGPLENVTEDEFHREFNTNVLGPILTTQEALKHFGLDGGSVINPAVTERVLRGIERLGAGFDSLPVPEPLTKREIEIVGMMAAGYNNREIATACFVAEANRTSANLRVSSKLAPLRRLDPRALRYRSVLLES